MAALWAAAQVLYLFAPLLVSALIAAFVHRYDLLARTARPIDAGATLGGRRVFGDGKTWRGVLVAVVGSIATVAIQRYVVGPRAGALAVVDYARASPLALGLAIGGGAMLGELPNSFVKRRLGIGSGETAKSPLRRAVFWTWDQVDLLTTAWPLVAIWTRPTAALVATSFALALAIHPLVALIGFVVGARRSAR
jgi:CDP-2,3-bis-(O-geranylgeranyl)-sn-glycerol synthase